VTDLADELLDEFAEAAFDAAKARRVLRDWNARVGLVPLELIAQLEAIHGVDETEEITRGIRVTRTTDVVIK
jgi:hypothetical protein